jgi:predicted nucleotidyltransferase
VTTGDLFGRVLGALEQAGIPCMLTGSFASSYHGAPRATQDMLEEQDTRVIDHAMPTEQDLRTAERIKEKILEVAGDAVERILFYGSRVTGRPAPSSDYDILVVLRDPVPDWTEASLTLSGLFDAFDRAVDVQVFGATEFEESRPVAGTVAYPADRHGVLLYAKPGRSSRGAGTAVG